MFYDKEIAIEFMNKVLQGSPRGTGAYIESSGLKYVVKVFGLDDAKEVSKRRYFRCHDCGDVLRYEYKDYLYAGIFQGDTDGDDWWIDESRIDTVFCNCDGLERSASAYSSG